MTTCEVAGELIRLLDRLQGVLGDLAACGESGGDALVADTIVGGTPMGTYAARGHSPAPVKRTCTAVPPFPSDQMCETYCNAVPPNCPAELCTCTQFEFDTSKFYPGVNLPGFDYGDSGNVNYPGNRGGYACVTNGIIDWVHGNGQNGVKLIRLPIAPQYIFETGPDAPDPWTFNPTFTGEGHGDKCTDLKNWQYEGFQPDYMAPLKHATDEGIFTILDVHQNTHHLCGLGSGLTATQFTEMWQEIAHYVIDNVPNHQYVMFELFNEPVDCLGHELEEDVWNKEYMVKTIEAIREIEHSKCPGTKHVILATTYKDWSGVHSWPGSGRLYDLAKALYDNSLTTKENVLIAGHQYCDAPYFSGSYPTGCDSNLFSAEQQQKWLDYADDTLAKYDLKWIMTEGNITCAPATKESCANMDLWTGTDGWLDKLKKSASCVGFTVWFISGVAKGWENSMGSHTVDGLRSWELYSKIYPTRKPSTGGDMYDFSKWLKQT